MNIDRKNIFNYAIKLVVILLVLKYVPYSKNNISQLAIVLVIAVLSCVLIDNILTFKSNSGEICADTCNVENFEDNKNDVDIKIDSPDNVNVEVTTKVETDNDVTVEKKTSSNKNKESKCSDNSKISQKDKSIEVRKELEQINELKQKLTELLNDAEKKQKFLNRNDSQYPEYENDMDFHSLPVKKDYKTKDYEFGFSYLPPENWYRCPTRPPVCKTDNPNVVQPVYLSDTTVDLKEWDGSRKLLQPDRINVEYIMKKLNQIEEKLNA